MKNLKKLFVINFIFILLLSACGSKPISSEMRDLLKDDRANIGPIDIVSTVSQFKEELENNVTMEKNIEQLYKDLGNNKDVGYTKEELDSISNFYKTYTAFLKGFCSYDVNKIRGEYYGSYSSQDPEKSSIALIYSFDSIPDILKNLDYDVINTFFDNSSAGSLSEPVKVKFIQRGNCIIKLEGDYCDKYSEIKDLLEKKIK